jgi:hypothetical protein
MDALLLAQAGDLQNTKVSEKWAKLRACALLEASLAVRKSWGLLSETLSSEESALYAGAFAEVGIPVKAIPSENLVVPPTILPVKALAFSTDSLAITVQKDEMSIPWKRLTGIFAFALAESFSKTVKVTEGPSAAEKIIKTGLSLATGIPLPIAKKKTVEKKVTSSELNFFLDVIFDEPLARYRVDGQHLGYGFLGPDKAMGAQANFRLLFDQLRLRAPQAFLNKGSRVLAARQPISNMGYETLNDIEKETKWYLSVRSH